VLGREGLADDIKRVTFSPLCARADADADAQ
jgi:hypothetical protein